MIRLSRLLAVNDNRVCSGRRATVIATFDLFPWGPCPHTTFAEPVSDHGTLELTQTGSVTGHLTVDADPGARGAIE